MFHVPWVAWLIMCDFRRHDDDLQETRDRQTTPAITLIIPVFIERDHLLNDK